MDSLQLFVLSIVQGLTEFLPVSSSAHLILVPVLSGWRDQGLALDVSVHFGTLMAVLAYFRAELRAMARDWAASLVTRELTADARLAWGVLIATLPVGLAGWLLHDFIEGSLRGPRVIAAATVGFGLLLWAADLAGRRARSEYQLRWTDVLLIGVAQVFALIPGTSRSGVTMTAGLLLGLGRDAAARFSFLLAIPVIFLAAGYESFRVFSGEADIAWGELFAGFALSGISAFVCIHVFLKLVNRIGMLPFVIYRLLLGAVLFYLFA